MLCSIKFYAILFKMLQVSKEKDLHNIHKDLDKGVHIIADFKDCTQGQDLMLDAVLLEKECRQAIHNVKLNEINYVFHQFPNAGVTGVVLLAESHFSIHTWPEINYLSMDIFVCNFNSNNTFKAESLFKSIINMFKPQKVNRQYIERA